MQQTSSASVKPSYLRSRADRAEWIEHAVDRYVDWLCSLAAIDIRMIVLFGSYAMGNFERNSDVDILVVADGLPEDAIDSYVLLTVGVPKDIRLVDFEPHPYDPSEFISSMKAGNQRPVDALVDGQILYIDPDYRRELLAVL